jgi:hypothetical protein
MRPSLGRVIFSSLQQTSPADRETSRQASPVMGAASSGSNVDLAEGITPAEARQLAAALLDTAALIDSQL